MLAVEAGLLTHVVEFESGPLTYVADRRLFNAALLATMTVGLLVDGKSAQRRDSKSSHRIILVERVFWGGLHVLLYVFFAAWTVSLSRPTHASSPHGSGSTEAVVWVLLAFSVAATAVLSWVSAAAILRRSLQVRHVVGVALLNCVIMWVGLRWTERLWRSIWQAPVFITSALTRLHDGDVMLTHPSGMPVVGAGGMHLLVTPGCSELDSLLSIGIAMASLALAERWWRYPQRLTLLALAIAAVWVGLNGLRLYGLILLGKWTSPQVCVQVAHSRWCHVGFALVGWAALRFAQATVFADRQPN